VCVGKRKRVIWNKLKGHFPLLLASLIVLAAHLISVLKFGEGLKLGMREAYAKAGIQASACDGDLNQDGQIDPSDLPLMVSAILTNNASGLCVDLNEDQLINSLDLHHLVNIILNPQTGNAYYIAPNGSDSNDGSIDHPWKTIMHAVKNSDPGDTVYMRGGDYIYGSRYEAWIRSDRGYGGSDGKYWTLSAYPGENVYLENVRFIIDANWVRIKGLHIQDSGFSVVAWAGLHTNVEIIGNTFTGPQPGYGAITFMANNGLVEGNRIEISGGGGSLDHGIYLHLGKNNVVRNNYITGTSGYGIHVYDEDKYSGITPKYENVLIEGNFVTNTNASGIILSAGESSSLAVEMDGVVVRRNIVTNCSDGITVRYYGQIRNVEIYNNTVYDNRRDGISVSAKDVDFVTIKNNILSSNGDEQISISSSLTHLVVSHNLYHQPESIGSGANDDSPVFGDPLFVNPSAEDFHIQANSPAIDAGVDVGLPYSGSAPDLGAFEYGQ
jgi:parallel beta-helix repeat protein